MSLTYQQWRDAIRHRLSHAFEQMQEVEKGIAQFKAMPEDNIRWWHINALIGITSIDDNLLREHVAFALDKLLTAFADKEHSEEEWRQIFDLAVFKLGKAYSELHVRVLLDALNVVRKASPSFDAEVVQVLASAESVQQRFSHLLTDALNGAQMTEVGPEISVQIVTSYRGDDELDGFREADYREDYPKIVRALSKGSGATLGGLLSDQGDNDPLPS